jgi:hypothetical protein
MATRLKPFLTKGMDIEQERYQGMTMLNRRMYIVIICIAFLAKSRL